MNIELRLKEVREGLDLTQKQMAEVLGLGSQVQVSRLEKGFNDPSSESLIKLAEKYDIDLNWLITGNGKHPFQVDEQQKAKPLDNSEIGMRLTSAAINTYLAGSKMSGADKEKAIALSGQIIELSEKYVGN